MSTKKTLCVLGISAIASLMLLLAWGGVTLIHRQGLAAAFSVDYGLPLPGGYVLTRTNSFTRAIEAPPDPYRFHPTHCIDGVAVAANVVSIGVEDQFVFGEVKASPQSELADIEAVGFFVLDTKTDALDKGLSHADWLVALEKRGISDPVVVEPHMLPTR